MAQIEHAKGDGPAGRLLSRGSNACRSATAGPGVRRRSARRRGGTPSARGGVFHDVGRVVFGAAGNVIVVAGQHDLLATTGPHPVRALYCAALT